MPGNIHASCHTADRRQCLIRPIPYYYALSRSSRFTTFYKVSGLHSDCRGIFFKILKI